MVGLLITWFANTSLPRRRAQRSARKVWILAGDTTRAMRSRIAFEPTSIAATFMASVSTPQMRESARRRITAQLDTQVSRDSLPDLLVDGGHRRLAVHFDKPVPPRQVVEFGADLPLVKDEGLVKVRRQRHVEPSFPVADGVRLLEFARERHLGGDVEPEGQVGK